MNTVKAFAFARRKPREILLDSRTGHDPTL